MSTIKVATEYDKEELAWYTPKLTLTRNAYLTVKLQKPGKVVIREKNEKGEYPMLPIRRHKAHTDFTFHIYVSPPSATIQVFTSAEPKEIKYAYI